MRANAVVSGIVNEPRIMEGTHVLDPQAVQNFYYEAYNIMRNVTGIGEGKGPIIVRRRPFQDCGSLTNRFRVSTMAS